MRQSGLKIALRNRFHELVLLHLLQSSRAFRKAVVGVQEG